MAQALPKRITFDQFIEWLPENSDVRYELHDGVIIEMPKPSGKHSNVTGFLIEELILVIIQMGKRSIWTIPRESIVKPTSESGYEPDIIVLDQEALSHEPRWNKESIIENATSVKLIIEVVSSNWRDDYYKKHADYEEMGIPEYWIVDYAALGGRAFIGNPKQPTISVYQLVEGEYQVSQFRQGEHILSPTFAELNLTTNQVFRLG
ncbi:Uma2 family endonuclease [Nostoc sp. LEGE 06077]|uniref:Uma2 family endonuclease n=1 Tax=Nostoc sp. LEGE 06077 TaxID=915325 RepID=UPI0018815958|nr:Uma2 family endonuclease [Nostoc sp. LEGE 06077]MBE9205033.1 Uma2 family endonuclease [Nostoc sp. LEGE 06077]